MNINKLDAIVENPFCARRIKPGEIPFFFEPDLSAQSLVELLSRHQWRGQIVGPHGSGKTALLACLLPLMERAGRRPLLIALHDGQRSLPRGIFRDLPPDPATLVIVDGYEQLAQWNRFALKRRCRRGQFGLLVTAHAPVGFPDLYRTSATLALAQRIVEHLQQGHAPLVTPADVAEQYSRYSGNVRETLFALYDLYQSRQQ
jgi:hypothetical protein